MLSTLVLCSVQFYFFADCLRHYHGRPQGGGARVGATSPPLTGKFKKNLFCYLGVCLLLLHYVGPFSLLFSMCFCSGLPPPYENFCVRPWALSHEAV